MKNKVEEFFDNIADGWNNLDNNYELINKLLLEIGIKENDKILDLACGKGVITPYLFNLSKSKVIGIDISSKMINYAKKINDDKSRYEFIHGDFINYDFKDKFDVIVIFNAYPHFLNPKELSSKAFKITESYAPVELLNPNFSPKPDA